MKPEFIDEYRERVDNIEHELDAIAAMNWSSNCFAGEEDTPKYEKFEKGLEILREAVDILNDVEPED